MEVLIDNEYATLCVHPEKKVIHHIFHKFVYGDIFKEVLTKGADAFIQHECTKWLSDDRGNSAIPKQDIEWGQVHWEPRILKKGWKFWALVMPETATGKMNMRKVVDHYQTIGVTVQTFTNPIDAMNWLEKQ
jgi:hypothetical protein